MNTKEAAMTTKMIDPVCGMSVEKGREAAAISHEGHEYLFCSVHCAGKFKANPSQYAEAPKDAGHSCCSHGAAKPKPLIKFEEGENVRVTTGPFANFSGFVDEVMEDKEKLRVMVQVFGRATPVVLDYSNVEKA